MTSLVAPKSKTATDGKPQEESGSVTSTASLLAPEARQTLSFGGRGLRDVTEDFVNAAKRLRPGQLVKDEFFTLFEAVGALEIMDPKMDSGYVPPDDTFESDFDPCSGLSAHQVLWVMDQLLCLEATWHDSYPLSQTIFTSLHVDRLLSPDNVYPYTFHYGQDPGTGLPVEEMLVHVALHAYCIALVKSCQLVLFMIEGQNFYEEEDFVTHLYGRELLPKTGSSQAIWLLDQALETVAKAGLPHDVNRALVGRLAFRKGFLVALEDENDEWPSLADLFKTIDETHNLAEPLPSAFSEKVQRQLATSTPPRPMLTVAWDGACKKFAKLFADVVEARRLTSSHVVQSPHCLQRATWAFSYRDPQPGAYARAKFQDILFGDQAVAGEVAHYELLLTDMRDLVLAGDVLANPSSFEVELTSDPRHTCSRLIESFMDKAIDEYLNIYRMVCQNRSRVRRTFTQAIALLDGLESEGMRVDEQINNAAPQSRLENEDGDMVLLDPLTSWTKFYKLCIMSWSVQLGFETDIYLPDELGGMYFFLSRLSAQRCDLIDHIQRFLFDRMRRSTASRDASAVAECLASQDWLKSLNAMSDITRTLSRALWRLYAILAATGIVKPPRRDFAQMQLLYEARMKSYLSVSNDQIPLAQDLESARKLDSEGSVESVCAAIADDTKLAKSFLVEVKKMTPAQAKYAGTEDEWKKEIKRLEITCVAVAVAASQLQSIAEKKGEAGTDDLVASIDWSIPPPGGGKRYHEWWVVPQLKEKK